MKHVNIPVFVPHLGCPHDCVFCNQKTITGVREFDFAAAEAQIEAALSTVDPAKTEAEIAFFGGSFTGIERGTMLSLLSLSDKYYDKGLIRSVRCSTRPDYIDDDILAILKEHHVKTVELGIQSMSDRVLEASMRGHTSQTSVNACRMVVDAGLDLVGQMMIGLPLSSPDDEIMTAERICELGAKGARIYPTVVFGSTALCNMAKDGSYLPLSVDEAVKRSADALGVFIKNKVEVIRIGLCESEGLHTASGIYAGAFHPALGELCISEYYRRRFEALTDGVKGAKEIIFEVSSGSTSKAVGQRRKNVEALRRILPGTKIRIIENTALDKYEIIMKVDGKEIQCV